MDAETWYYRLRVAKMLVPVGFAAVLLAMVGMLRLLDWLEKTIGRRRRDRHGP